VDRIAGEIAIAAEANSSDERTLLLAAVERVCGKGIHE
jgi:hypothetical protein